EVANAVQDQIQKTLGLHVTVKIADWVEHTKSIDEGQASFFRLGWIADYPCPQNFLDLLYGGNIPQSGPSNLNSTRYNNPAFDSLFNQGLQAPNQQLATRFWAKADALAIHDAPILILYY